MRLLIFDDQLLFGEALSSLISLRDHEVLGCPTTPEQALDIVKDRSVALDACLVEARQPAEPALSAVALLRKEAPDLAIVVLATDLDGSVLWTALDRGADAVCLKADGLDEVEKVLLHAVSNHAEGGRPEKIWSRGASAFAKKNPNSTSSDFLTPKEAAVLAHLVRGASTTSIAAELGVGHATVRTHLQHLFHKFGVHSRLALVACAVRSGLVDVNREAPSNGTSSSESGGTKSHHATVGSHA